eukprot:233435_1
MSHKPFNGLKFTNSVPKFLQNAMAKHGMEQNSSIAKKFESEDGGNNNEINDTNNSNSSDEKPELLPNGERKDTEFEKPIVVNIEQITDLNMKQREQLNDIMRKTQIKQIKDENNENDNNEDEDTIIAKNIMKFAPIPSQNVIGMEKKRKPKFKFTKKITDKNESNSMLGKRKMLNHDNDNDNNNDNINQPKKKRKIYQEMSRKQLKRQRKK